MKNIAEKQKYKKSDLRESILNLLRRTGVHPTAAWIYDELRREHSNVSIASVYRNLGILVQQGEVNSVMFGSPVERYDANLDEHYHFICEKCSSVFDLKIPVNDSLNKDLLSDTGFIARKHRIDFYGVCKKCASL